MSDKPVDFCAVCFKTNNPMLLCARCRGRNYCSIECQKKDWRQHKPTCRDERDEYGLAPNDYVQRIYKNAKFMQLLHLLAYPYIDKVGHMQVMLSKTIAPNNYISPHVNETFFCVVISWSDQPISDPFINKININVIYILGDRSKPNLEAFYSKLGLDIANCKLCHDNMSEHNLELTKEIILFISDIDYCEQAL